MMTEVNYTSSNSLVNLIKKSLKESVTEVHLLISTTGGIIPNGIGLYNFLRSLPMKIIAYNIGNVDSIGNVLFLAGEERYACPQSTFLMHGVKTQMPMIDKLEQPILSEKLNGILVDQKRIAAIITENSDYTSEELEKMFLIGVNIDAPTAKQKKLINDIRMPSIPEAAVIYTVQGLEEE